MAEILALGSATIRRFAADERMAYILRRMLQNRTSGIAARSPPVGPKACRQSGQRRGLSAAARHRADLVAALMKTRAALDAFNPDFVVIWGDDQYETSRRRGAAVLRQRLRDVQDHRAGRQCLGEPAGELFETPAMCGRETPDDGLIESGFDAAYAYKPLHTSLGHAVRQCSALSRLQPCGISLSVVPLAINCYGRKVISQRGGFPNFEAALNDDDLDPPAPSRSSVDLGAATARSWPLAWRVAVSPHPAGRTPS